MNEKKLSVIMPSYENQKMQKESILTLQNNTQIKFNMMTYPGDINHGWMKSCNEGIKRCMDSDYIVLANDDILVPNTSDWAEVMMNTMDNNPEIGALSVLSYNVGGYQQINVDNCTVKSAFEVPYCIFFFVMLRKSAIEKVGLLDEDLPGGDDLDYCIRLRKAGYKVAVTPNVFIWHHYGQTGKRVYSTWDNMDYTFNIDRALIRKHGLKSYIMSKYTGGQL